MTAATQKASRPGYPPMLVHRFTIGTERKTARDLAHCGDVTEASSRSCAARKLARVLVAAGEPDGPVMAFGPDGALRYRVNSLYAFARTTIRENPSLRAIPFDETEASRLRSFRPGAEEASDDDRVPNASVSRSGGAGT